jgi:hypothetical protein
MTRTMIVKCFASGQQRGVSRLQQQLPPSANPQSFTGKICRENTRAAERPGVSLVRQRSARSIRTRSGVRSTSDKHTIQLQAPHKSSFKVSIGQVRHPIFTRTEARVMNNFGGRWKYYRFRCGYNVANFHSGYESGLKDMTCARKKRRASYRWCEIVVCGRWAFGTASRLSLRGQELHAGSIYDVCYF